MLAGLKIPTRIDLIPLLVALAVLASSAIGLWPLRSQMLEERRFQLWNLLNLALPAALAFHHHNLKHLVDCRILPDILRTLVKVLVKRRDDEHRSIELWVVAQFVPAY
jgi:hypothetical protein